MAYLWKSFCQIIKGLYRTIAEKIDAKNKFIKPNGLHKNKVKQLDVEFHDIFYEESVKISTGFIYILHIA